MASSSASFRKVPGLDPYDRTSYEMYESAMAERAERVYNNYMSGERWPGDTDRRLSEGLDIALLHAAPLVWKHEGRLAPLDHQSLSLDFKSEVKALWDILGRTGKQVRAFRRRHHRLTR